MAVLHHKLARDLRHSLGTLLTVVSIIAAGAGSFVGFGSAQRILESSQAAYYRQYRLADFWVDLKKVPLAALERVAAMPDVAAVESRVVFEVILDLPGKDRPLAGRLISAPADDVAGTINGVCLVRGSGFSPDRDEELILGEAFAQAHGLSPGDRLPLILNRKRVSFFITGTAISPEYVYLVRGEGDLLPDPEHFGILYIKERYAREILDFEQAANQVVGLLSPGARQPDQTLEQIAALLEPYGVLAVTPRSRQASNRFLSDEIAGLSVTAVVMPVIFLSVAALALNLLMHRLAERQRSVIGTLKALGYRDREVLQHFLSFGLVVGLLGGIAGIGVGLVFCWTMIRMYRLFYQFPRFLVEVHPDLLAIGLFISVAFALLGTVNGVWVVLRLSPAEAMRPRPPQSGGAVWLERWPRLWRSLGFRSHMALRSVARNRTRTLSGVISSALAVCLLLLTLSMYDSMAELVDFQFDAVLRSDVDIGMRQEQSSAALLEAQALPGVDHAEAALAVVCNLSNGRRSRRMGILGLAPGHRLLTPMSADRQPVAIPRHGLVMSRKLAELLDLGVGDEVRLTPVRGRHEPRVARLAAVVDSYLGLDCYADLNYLSGLVAEAQAVNTLQLAVDPQSLPELYAAVKTLPNAQALAVRADIIHNIEDTFVKTLLFSLGMMIAFSGVIALGSTLNASLLEIGDRRREIALLRVLGYAPGAVAGIFLRQNLFIHGTACVLAIPLGYVMCSAMVTAYDTELYRMPLRFHGATVLLAIMIASGFLILAQRVIARLIPTLDWQESIKFKE